MIRRLGVYIVRARRIFLNEGLILLGGRAIAYMARRIFDRGTFYLYQHSAIERDEKDFLPRIDNYEVHIVSSNIEAHELEKNGMEFRSYQANAHRRLEQGAIAFCIFQDKKLMHIGWLAMSPDAEKMIDPLPYKVNFSEKQGCTGGTFTVPEYRGKGLMLYGYWLRLTYFWRQGWTTSRNAVDITNTASNKVHAKFKPKIYAKASMVNILGYKIWRETPVKGEIAIR